MSQWQKNDFSADPHAGIFNGILSLRDVGQLFKTIVASAALWR